MKAKDEKRHQGQNGPAITLVWEELNQDEQRLAMRVAERKKASIAELEDLFLDELDEEKRNSRVRNGLRRLCRGRLVKNAGRGTYAPDRKLEKARDPLARAKALLPKAKADKLKCAALVLAAIDFGGNTTRIEKVAKISRGYAIPRVNRLKRNGRIIPQGIKDAEALEFAIKVAEGQDKDLGDIRG